VEELDQRETCRCRWETGTKGMEGGLGLGSEDPALSFHSVRKTAPLLRVILFLVLPLKRTRLGVAERDGALLLMSERQGAIHHM
jgi:hypothetical protein